MKKLKLTGWYEGHQKPVRVGVYERWYVGFAVFCYWNGTHWGCLASTVDSCQENKMIFGISPDQDRPWRGISK